ncbi:MAG TPA: 7-cyano-7-deazaguanine synthase [Pyrinomonadaceae bacterium]
MNDLEQDIDLPADGRGRRVLVLVSGGMDSTVALFLSKQKGFDVVALEFDNYTTKVGMTRPAPEGRNVEEICQRAAVPLLRSSFPVATNCAATAPNIVTIVESTMMYCTLAAAFAHALNAQYLIISFIKDDWFDESDQATDRRPDHYYALNRLLQTEYGETAPRICAPLIYLSKTEVARLGRQLGAPLEITWSCTRAHDVPCGVCGQCRLRNQALAALEASAEGEPPGAATGATSPPPRPLV